MAQMVSLEIDSIAAGGDGVGRNNGLVVFVPRTAPGDLVTARIAGKGTFARGSLRTIARASSERIEPPCPHYTRDRCGGCQLQPQEARGRPQVRREGGRRRAIWRPRERSAAAPARGTLNGTVAA
ncbi:MAG: TRAM domain-containing protein [Gemmatimonadaceae bacterium]